MAGGGFYPDAKTYVGASPPASFIIENLYKNSNGPCSSKVRRCA